MNTVNYQVELKPENAPKIDQINRILLGDAYTKTAAPEEKAKAPAKEEPTGATVADLKKAAKAAKSDHGEEFAIEAIGSLGFKTTKSLATSLKNVGAEDYVSLISAWEKGPAEDDGLGDDEDDGLGDDEDATVDPDAVKTALRAKSKADGRDATKAVMIKHKIKSLSDVDKASQETLSALMGELA